MTKPVLYLIIMLLLNVSLLSQNTETTAKTNYAYRLTMRSYRNLYGTTPESLNLINFFEKKRRKANIYFETAGVMSLMSGVFQMPIVSITCVPLLGLGIAQKSIYSRRRMYFYLTKQKEIPARIQKRIEKYAQKHK